MCVCSCLHACVLVFRPKADIVGQVLGPRFCVCVFVCVCACIHVCDQLSAQVVFMKLSENLFFKVVLDFDLLSHP